MTHMEKCKALRADTTVHYNCAQAVLVPFAAEMGITEEQAYKMGAHFGSGMRHGSTCGAVTGALIALGMAYGDDSALLHEKVAEFRAKFTERFGALNCRDLVGYDFGVPGERDKAMAAGATIEKCPAFVVTALEILDDMLEDL